MMISKAYSKIVDLLDDLTFDEMVEVRDLLISNVSEKEARFTELVQQLADAWITIQNEFPYSYIPLQITPDQVIDLNECIVPDDFVANARIEG